MNSRNTRRLASLTLAVVALGAFAGAASAAPAPKTTGDVWADRTAEGAGMAHMVFVAQDTDPAKGTFTYSDANGAYTFAVQDVEIVDNKAHFAGPIVSNNYPGFEYEFVGIAVIDGGESGIGVDGVNGAGYHTLQAAIGGYGTLDRDYLTATAGNLQVHDHS